MTKDTTPISGQISDVVASGTVWRLVETFEAEGTFVVDGGQDEDDWEDDWVEEVRLDVPAGSSVIVRSNDFAVVSAEELVALRATAIAFSNESVFLTPDEGAVGSLQIKDGIISMGDKVIAGEEGVANSFDHLGYKLKRDGEAVEILGSVTLTQSGYQNLVSNLGEAEVDEVRGFYRAYAGHAAQVLTAAAPEDQNSATFSNLNFLIAAIQAEDVILPIDNAPRLHLERASWDEIAEGAAELGVDVLSMAPIAGMMTQLDGMNAAIGQRVRSIFTDLTSVSVEDIRYSREDARETYNRFAGGAEAIELPQSTVEAIAGMYGATNFGRAAGSALNGVECQMCEAAGARVLFVNDHMGSVIYTWPAEPQLTVEMPVEPVSMF